jgi:hypothetical protein
MIVLILISSMAAIGFAFTIVIIRHYTTSNQRKKSTKDSSTYSVSRYWRRQVASTSFDQLTPAIDRTRHSTSTTSNNDETTRIIKSSFSWPEATLVHHEQEENIDASRTVSSSSSSVSNSSTMEHIHGEPATLVFGIRWHEPTQSLIVRIINGQNLFLSRQHRTSNLLDSYVRVELLASNDQGR